MKRRTGPRTSIPAARPPRSPKPARPPASPVRRFPRRPSSKVARIVDDAEASLLDVIDSLLDKGVVLNAEVILALANVDLVYLRLSALLSAADRVLPRARR